jgi:peroxiredoxin
LSASLPKPLAFGDIAPPFERVKGVDGEEYSLRSFDDKSILVFIFIANRCPTARVYNERLKTIQRDYGSRGVQIIAVNSDSSYLYSAESLEEMEKIAKERGFNFPYLKDEDQSIGKRYGAWVTLHAFVFDKQRRLRYRGRVDDSRDEEDVEVSDLRNALDDILVDREVKVPETRPFACFIEYV